MASSYKIVVKPMIKLIFAIIKKLILYQQIFIICSKIFLTIRPIKLFHILIYYINFFYHEKYFNYNLCLLLSSNKIAELISNVFPN